jgi:hypothetical protein
MTKEVLSVKDTNCDKAKGEVVSLESKNENTQSEGLLLFQKQQITNLQVKEEMARELTAMELPEGAVNQILHIEDEPPF